MRQLVVLLALALVSLVPPGAHAEAPVPLVASKHYGFFAGGPVRVSPEGPKLEITRREWEDRLQIFSPGGQAPGPGALVAVQVLDEPRLTLWIRTADLQPVMTRRTFLAASAQKAGRPVAADSPGIWLHAGARVTVAARTKRAARVVFDESELQAEGWVPLAALGTIYQAEEPLVRRQAAGGVYQVLPNEITLLATPEGKVLATLTSHEWSSGGEAGPLRVHRLGKTRKNHELVEWTGEWATVFGWMERPADPGAAVAESSGRGTIATIGRRPERRPMIDIPAGTPVLDRPGGTVIGRFDQAARHVSSEQRDGATRLTIQTWVGRADVWVPITPPPR